AQDAAREDRARWQVTEAQLQARLRVAADRDRQLETDVTTAGARLDALMAELGDIALADRELAEHIASWRLDLESRRVALGEAEGHLREAEAQVQRADAELEHQEQSLNDARRRAGQMSEDLHQAELRFTELSGRRAMIRERLETEWRRPLEAML